MTNLQMPDNRPTSKFKYYVLAALCGALAGILFLRLSGPFYAFLKEHNAQFWVGYLPGNLQGWGFLLHLVMIEIVTMAVIIFLVVLFAGKATRIGIYPATLISFVSYLAAQSIFDYMVLGQLTIHFFPSFDTIIVATAAIFLFLGSYKFIAPTKKRKRQHNSLLQRS